MSGAGDRFVAGVADAAAPLGVWALHFFGCYIAVAVGCARGVDEPALRAGLLIAGAAAIMFTGGWLLRACVAVRRGERDLLGKARLGCAALATTGIAWTSAPLWTLAVCQFG
ncbi:MAG TPA: hypothetical protein VGP22_10000 [Albitalea sp.]|jgi:hypothetical protein|nr:hypothetical protein [Albitalea sp.]